MPPKSNAVDLQHHPQSVFAAPRSWKIGAVFNPSRYSRLRHNIFALRLLMLSALGFEDGDGKRGSEVEIILSRGVASLLMVVVNRYQDRL
jgi:hypothetical protein